MNLFSNFYLNIFNYFSPCGFYKSTNAYSFGGKLYPAWVFKVLFHVAIKKAEKYQVEELMIFNGGSFFNERKLPLEFQNFAIKKIKSSSVSMLIVESRCEYISEDRIASIKSRLGSKDFCIAIGLESQDDFVRNSLINKSLPKKMFEKKDGYCPLR